MEYKFFDNWTIEGRRKALCKFVNENNLKIIAITDSSGIGGSDIITLYYEELNAQSRRKVQLK